MFNLQIFSIMIYVAKYTEDREREREQERVRQMRVRMFGVFTERAGGRQTCCTLNSPSTSDLQNVRGF